MEMVAVWLVVAMEMLEWVVVVTSVDDYYYYWDDYY